MSEELAVAPEVVAPIEPVIAATEPVVAPIEPIVAPIPVELPELRYEYQPADEAGRPLGGKQVIKYKTQEELIEKLSGQNTELVRKLRQVSRKQRLGILDAENIPADAERLPEILKFDKKTLTVEERFQIAQDLTDPEKFEEARDKLLESGGFTAMQDAITQQQLVTNQLLARANASVFFETHPEFYACSDNVEVMIDWMIKNGLHPTVKNFETAQSAMAEAGLLLSSPIVREESPTPPAAPVAALENLVPNTQTPAEPVARISDPEPPQAKRQERVPSGLNSRIASNSGVETVASTLTLVDIDRMSSDEYKRRLQTDKSFVELVNKLEAARPPRPRR
jgi:hypothetical protein